MNRPMQTLLLVEDFAPDRELYRRCLLADASCAYQIIEADCAAAGLALCRTQPINAILLDYSLPDMDGLAFLEALNVQNTGEVPPIVMISGAGDEIVAVRAIKLGAEDYLTKHRLTPELLQLTMRSAIENARLRLQLRQSEDRFRVSIENMLDCFGVYSAIRDEAGQIIDFRIDYLNAAALESNQMNTADIGKGLCELLSAHRETGLFDEYCRVTETGEPLVKENLIYADVFGTQYLTRAYDVHANKLGDGFVASWRDVTARKQAEVRLYEANQRMTTIWESMTDAYITLDPDWRIVYSNCAATEVIRQLTKLAPKEFLGKTYWEVFPWSVGQITEREYRRAMAERVAVHFEMLYEPSRGCFEVHAYPSKEGLGIYFRDICDRKRDEQRLRESEERLQVGIQVAGFALARFDYASNTVELSKEAAALYGIPTNELIITRDRLHATFHPDEREDMARIIEQVIDPAGNGWFAREHRVVWANGEVRWLSVRKQVFFDRSGAVPRPSYAILAAIDITDRKQADAERERLLAEAEAANRSKDEFVAIVAHELRSPLNSIQGWAKLLQTRKVNEATLAKALDMIVRNTEAQVQLVEDLLDISRMVRGNLDLNLAPVNLATAIEAALDVVRPQAQAKQIQLETQLMLPPPISGDFNRLQQIVINLLTNAIKFTPAQGLVDIQLAQIDNHVQMSVRDTGKGIEPEFLLRLFERFQQGQKNTGSKDGLGLGLAIVKNLVELHQGIITAESPGIDRGATFTVQFPLLTTPAILQEQSLVAVNANSLAGVRILIVDDEPDQIDLITFVLKEYGAEVQSVTTAIAALDCLTQFKPSILISDLAMPERNGYELLQQVRLLPEGEIPAIVLTAYASTTTEERSLQAGFQCHLSKPVEPEVLIAAIADLVGEKKTGFNFLNPSPNFTYFF